MRYFSFFLAALLSACAPVAQTSVSSRTLGTQAYSSVGDIMFRADAKESLPNAFGRADLFGRTRDRGFSELRYMGLNRANQPVFRRRDVDVLTNETTMSRSQADTTVFSVAQPAGAGIIVTGVATSSPQANVQVLPPDTVEFALDLSKGRTITIHDHTVEIVAATQAGVTFIPR